ncbi:MAG: hypothetical protein INR73_25165 [Williamsia sp.]|nr:hypothetical protein [Williamsia sp.]
MKTFLVKKDFDVETQKGPAGIFQVISVLDEQGNDLTGKMGSGSGLFFENDEMLIKFMRENNDIGANEEIRILEDN